MELNRWGMLEAVSPSTPRPKRRGQRLGSLAALLYACTATVSQADGPVVHVHFEPDPAEDLQWGARVAHGRLPAALDTPSGLVQAPADASHSASIYGGTSPGQGVDAAYQIDRLTTQPEVVRYDDPFSPSVAPFKRLFAFDRVGEQLELAVARTELREIPVGGSVQAGEDAFYGDVQVDLIAGRPIRIPTVAPGARLLALHTDPPLEVTVQSDGAGNWFAVADRSLRARLLMQLSVPRAVFGGPFAPVSWAELSRYVVPLPPHVHDEADRVLEHLDVSQALDPGASLAILVRHFRGFAPSAALPQAATTEGLYEELSLSQKGVCRHRSYAFLITALRLGLPTRFVHNEAHAWVEVFDGRLWHRIDLGGAAGRMEYERPAEVPLHRPPPDLLPWPANAHPGRSAPGIQPPSDASGPLGSRSGPAAEPTDGGMTEPGPRPGGREPASRPEVSQPGLPPDALTFERPAPGDPRADLTPSVVTLELGHREIRRGHPLRVLGRLRSADAGPACGYGRVDFALRSTTGRSIPLGSLPTDAQGNYSGEVIVPLDVPVGDHSIEAASPGGPGCGPSR